MAVVGVVLAGASATGISLAMSDPGYRQEDAPGPRAVRAQGSHVTPPRGGDRAAVSAGEAVSTFRNSALGGFAAGRSDLRVRLVRYTNDVRRDENGAQVARDRLVWQVIVPDAPMVQHHPLGLAGPTGAPPTCDFAYFVDAGSGDYVEAYQSCSPETDG